MIVFGLQHYRQHLKNEVERTAASSELAMQQAAEEEAEHLALMEYNHQENLRVAALRETRLVSSYYPAVVKHLNYHSQFLVRGTHIHQFSCALCVVRYLWFLIG